MSSPKPRRRWYQFGLSTLLIGLTLFSLPLGYVAWEREQCRRGDEAVDILRQNPEIIVGWHWVRDSQFNRPKWLTFILGDETFRKVDGAYLVGDSVSDSDLRLLALLPNLTIVQIKAPNVTDAGVSHLRSLRSVEVLSIESNLKVSATTWEVPREWHQLYSLSLLGTQFGDEDVQRIQGLTNLERLDLSRTNITDAGLEGLLSLQNLSSLQLHGTQISDAGLVHLKKLTNLKYLDLSDTEIKDAGLAQLRSLRNLESLRLARTKVSHAGLQYLKHLEKLKYLDLEATGVTTSGAANLEKSLPNAFISH